LELMKVHGYGTYLDDKEQVFCTVNGVEKLREQVKKKMEEE